MGGYGLFVWLSFAAAGASLTLVWVDGFLTKQKLFKKVLKEQQRLARINAAKNVRNSDGENKWTQEDKNVWW